MYTCTILVEGLRQYGTRVMLHLKFKFTGPPPTPRPRRYAIEYESDLRPILEMLGKRYDVARYEIQPSLLFTWEGEEFLVQEALHYNLHHSES